MKSQVWWPAPVTLVQVVVGEQGEEDPRGLSLSHVREV